mmetsp:Transcript_27486/g.69932  ORF Transcript_27486/g.69932 Transcript_27486/m.69932 type:complete len:126 (+) Transcript_27486:121-498(+)
MLLLVVSQTVDPCQSQVTVPCPHRAINLQCTDDQQRDHHQQAAAAALQDALADAGYALAAATNSTMRMQLLRSPGKCQPPPCPTTSTHQQTSSREDTRACRDHTPTATPHGAQHSSAAKQPQAST